MYIGSSFSLECKLRSDCPCSTPIGRVWFMGMTYQRLTRGTEELPLRCTVFRSRANLCLDSRFRWSTVVSSVDPWWILMRPVPAKVPTSPPLIREPSTQLQRSIATLGLPIASAPCRRLSFGHRWPAVGLHGSQPSMTVQNLKPSMCTRD